MQTVALILALSTAGWALWVRRDCWRSPWEQAPNISMVCSITALALVTPVASTPIDSYLYHLTGVGDLGDFTAHSMFIWSAAAVGYHAATRLNDVAPRIKKRILLCIAPLTAVRFMVFATGQYSLYWTVVCGTVIGLLLWSWLVMRELWDEPKHRRAITVYTAVMAAGVVTCVAEIYLAITGTPQVEITLPVWAGCWAGSVGWALAFGYSWHRREDAITEAVPVG